MPGKRAFRFRYPAETTRDPAVNRSNSATQGEARVFGGLVAACALRAEERRAGCLLPSTDYWEYGVIFFIEPAITDIH